MKEGVKFRLALAASILIVLSFQLGLAKQQKSPPAPASAEPSTAQVLTGGDRPTLQKREWRYRLRPGDVLELDFLFSPEFNQSAAVQPDGYITLRGLSDLRVEGKTIPELTELLRNAYSKILHEPVITVVLKDFEKSYFIVGGEVGSPGKFELRGDTTVTQAIAIAGGFRDTAKHSQVLLFRRISEEWTEARKLDIKRMLRNGNLAEDPHLRPGDMLFVPKNILSKIKPFIPTPSLGTYTRTF